MVYLFFAVCKKKLQNYRRVTTGVLAVIQDGDHAKIPNPGDMMSNQNPYPGDICDSQIPVGCPIPSPLELDTDRCIMTEQKDVIILLDHVVGA